MRRRRVSRRTLDNALPKLAWWIERDPSLADRATWALDATGFVVASLSGVPVMDSITAADYRLPGVDAPVPSPAPVDPMTPAGGLQPGWAERLGVPAGLPVIAGTYDSFVDIAAAGVRGPGDSGLVLGSTMIVCRATGAELDPPPGLGVSAYPGEGTLIGGWTLAGGLVLDWFETRFGGGEDLTAVAPQAERPRLLALPYLAGERTPLWDPLARGALVGLTPDVGPAEVYRALVESLALVVLDHAERLEQALGPAVSWRVTGGGVRNEPWLQATADALGAPLEIAPDAAEGVGPSLLALRALGVDTERRPVRTVMPDPRDQRAAARPAHPLPRAVPPRRADRARAAGRSRTRGNPPVIPDTMRVARLHGTADLRVETVPVPRPGPDEVLVRIEACGICPTDARKYAIGTDHGDYPLNPGHEWVGRVVAAGPEVDGLDPGTRVYGDTYAGYAEFATITGRPDGWSRGALPVGALPLERAIFVEPLADCLHAVHDQAQVTAGSRVAVVGAGSMGLQLTAVAARVRRTGARGGAPRGPARAGEAPRRGRGGGPRALGERRRGVVRRHGAGRDRRDAGSRRDRRRRRCRLRARGAGGAVRGLRRRGPRSRSISTGCTTRRSRSWAASGWACRRTSASSATRRRASCSPAANSGSRSSFPTGWGSTRPRRRCGRCVDQRSLKTILYPGGVTAATGG